MGIKVSTKELTELIKSVETELGTLLKSETEKLAKGDEDKAPEPKPEEGSDEGSESPAPDASAPADEGSESPAPDAAPAAEGAAPAGDPMAAPGGAPPSHEQLCAELAQMQPEEVKAIYLAAKATLMQGAGPSASPAPGADASAAGPSAPAAAPSAPPPGLGKDEMEMSDTMEKSGGAPSKPAAEEKKLNVPALKAEVKANPDGSGKMLKAESDAKLSKAESEIADLKSQVEGLLKIAEMQVGLPQRKAVTGISYVAKGDLAKSETVELTRPEVVAKLSTKSQDSKLSKSDRAAINSFILNPKASQELVKHLLG